MSSKRKSLKEAPASPGASVPAAVPSQSLEMFVDFTPPDTSASAGAPQYICLSPLEMTARELLPDDRVVVVSRASGTPVAAGLVWPVAKLERTRVTVPCVPLGGLSALGSAGATATGAGSTGVKAQGRPSLGGSTPRKGAETTSSASLAVDIVLHSAYPGPPCSECLTLYVQRPAQALGTAAGASLDALHKVLRTAVVPPEGTSMMLGGMTVSLYPTCSTLGSYGIITARTRLVEGAAPAEAPGTATASGTVAGKAGQDGKQPERVPFGGLQEQAAEIEGLIRAACAASLAGAHDRRLAPARGALLVGPPGTGKTLLARAIAERCGLQMKVVNGPEVLSAVVGESEASLRRAFSSCAGGLLFIDELDGLAPARGGMGGGGGGGGEVETRLVATLLTIMDGLQPASSTSPGTISASPSQGSVKITDATRLYAQEEDTLSGNTRNSGSERVTGAGPVFVLAATNRASAIDPALRRPGRFDREISIPIPTQAAREDILAVCLGRYPHTLKAEEVQGLAGRMHGYVGADIAAVCREAALAALQRHLRHAKDSDDGLVDGMGNLRLAGSDGGTGEGRNASAPMPRPASPPRSEGSTASLSGLFLTLEDLSVGMRLVQPSALREIAVEVPTVTWADIGGQEDVKMRLQEAVEWPLSHAAAFEALGIRPPRGVLLYGPPGCSKTMMARAMASTGRMNFVGVKGPELLSKYVGDSEKAVAEVFHRARAAAPCVIFFDEFDSLAPRRGGGGGEDGSAGVSVRVVSQLLTELDGVTHLKQVVVVAATNRPDLIDPALLRPGRVDRLLYVGLPDAPARSAIVRKHVARVPHEPGLAGEEGLTAIRQLCEDGGVLDGYSGAEVVGILREAALLAVRDYMACVPPLPMPVPAWPGLGGGSGVQAAGDAHKSDGAAQTPALPTLRVAHIAEAAAKMPKGVTPSMLAFYDAFRRHGR